MWEFFVLFYSSFSLSPEIITEILRTRRKIPRFMLCFVVFVIPFKCCFQLLVCKTRINF